MGLMKKRFARWTAHKLHRMSDGLKKLADGVNHWGKHGHMVCPLCGTVCHLDNIDTEEGLCFPCSPTPEAIKGFNDEPDAHVLTYGDSHVIRPLTQKAHFELKGCAASFVGARMTGDGTLLPANKSQVQQAIGFLRMRGLEVELKRYT
jgi:hypothetical protein